MDAAEAVASPCGKEGVMFTRTKFGLTLSVAALTFAGLASAFDLGTVDCAARFDPAQVGGSSPITGFLLHEKWSTDLSKGEGLDIRVEVPVPAKVPGLLNLEEAIHTTMMVTMSRGKTVYAECTVKANPAVTQRGMLEYGMMVRRESGVSNHAFTR